MTRGKARGDDVVTSEDMSRGLFWIVLGLVFTAIVGWAAWDFFYGDWAPGQD